MAQVMTVVFPAPAAEQRTFLFLQGPPGNFFWLLGQRIIDLGHRVRRINLNGGDRFDWPKDAVDYRGRLSKWAAYFDNFLVEHKVTDLMLYGDCRPMHRAAHGMAKLRDVRIHVFEEGYIRPDWVTLERDGVNGHSTLPQDPKWLLEQSLKLPPIAPQPGLPGDFKKRASESYWYYHRVVMGRMRFPFYKSHRQGTIILEGFGWLNKFRRAKQQARDTEKALLRIDNKAYFLLPLQLTNDYQIRTHSPFDNMQIATTYIIDNFINHAPPDTILVVKEHPLENSFFDWRNFVLSIARKHYAEDRVVYLAGGDLASLCGSARGMVTVNSTSATFALPAGIPVIVLGDAIYDIPHITHQGSLETFWTMPKPANPEVYAALLKVLHNRCLVRGGFGSVEAIDVLLDSTMERLFEEEKSLSNSG